MMAHVLSVFNKHSGQYMTFRALCNQLPLSFRPADIKYAVKQLMKEGVVERRQMVIEGNAKTMVYGYGKTQ